MPTSVDETLRRAIAALQSGNVGNAEQSLRAILRSQPGHGASLNLLGVVLSRTGRFADAESCMRKAIERGAASDATFYNYGVVLQALKRPAEALEQFDRALAANPGVTETWNNRGTVLNELKRYKEAIGDFDRAIAIRRDYAAAYCNKAKSLAQLKDYDSSLATYDQVLAIHPNLLEAWIGRGIILIETERHAEARDAFARALVLKPDSADAWCGQGDVRMAFKQFEEARAAYEKALTLNPNLIRAQLGWGDAQSELNHFAEAFSTYDKVAAQNPESWRPWRCRGRALVRQLRYKEASIAFDQALALEQAVAELWVDQGHCRFMLRSYDDAAAAFRKAITLKPRMAEAWYGEGCVLTARKQDTDALAAYNRAFELKPDVKYLEGTRLNAKLQLCDWSNIDAEMARLLAKIRNHKLASTPFTLLSIPSSPVDQLNCAKRFVAEHPAFPPAWRGERYSHDRIRIAYVSSDLRDHPVAEGLVRLLEEHDKSRFEVSAISLGTAEDAPLRSRIKKACNHFVDVLETMSDSEIIGLMQQHEVDIAIDLNGYTEGFRPGIFWRRPAPIQVNFFGYAGTMGSDCYDYIIGDNKVISEASSPFYIEKLVHLPVCFFPPGIWRRASGKTPSRAECGLPQKGFVFCCFNNTYKFLPAVFDVWMKILMTVEGSVLWLTQAQPTTMENLRAEATKRGVAPERLVFAPRVPDIADHLARHRQADLFLDTVPYNAHATARNALWSGLPVLTCMGETFASRVAASLLNSVGLNELITSSMEDYEALAIRLAQDAGALTALKEKLGRDVPISPLIDIKRYTRNIEEAYEAMWRCYQRGELPAPIDLN